MIPKNHGLPDLKKDGRRRQCPATNNSNPSNSAGRDGLIACHVKTLSDEDARSWKLESAGAVVLFDVAGKVGEMLSLSGGPGGGKPCANCNCGRREAMNK